ncbi:hypothetical protein Peur_021346 [Populus x canadensis]
MDLVWIHWIHHFYLNSGTIWSVHKHHSSSPLWKAVISIRDLLLQLYGDSESSITLLSSWSTGAGKLRTRDRLVFIPTNPNCMFCRQMEESHNHLFFAREWTCRLWAMIKSWLQIGRTMQTLTSAIHGLHSQRNNLEARMRRVSLGIMVYLIWEERNKWVFYGQSKEIATVFRSFQILFYIVFHFYEKDHLILHVG